MIIFYFCELLNFIKLDRIKLTDQFGLYDFFELFGLFDVLDLVDLIHIFDLINFIELFDQFDQCGLLNHQGLESAECAAHGGDYRIGLLSKIHFF